MTKEATLRIDDHSAQALDTLAAIGRRIRELRARQGMTLLTLGEMTGLSSSMLSLVERGKTSPSIGTLIVICSALKVHMTDLLGKEERPAPLPVIPVADQPVFTTPEGVSRRILGDDRVRGIEIAINEYEPDSGSVAKPVHHAGYEYGIVIEGVLTVELDGTRFMLRPGDLISYESLRDHRIWNYGKRRARALWINLHRS